MTIKKDLPAFLATGEKARLIPVVSDGSKEGRATSILLSTLSAVNDFAQSVFGAIDVRIGTRTRIEVYTEIVFADKEDVPKIRPDGLIIIDTGRGQWKAIVEAKIGNTDIEPEQVKDYIALAKKFDIDAVITISNQYAALPTHHPIAFKPSELKGVKLYHWSWMFILTEAILLLKSTAVEDVEQRFIMSEMIRYYDHDKVGVSGFEQMNEEWKDVAHKVKNGSDLSKASTEVENTLSAWHQAVQDLCLTMGRELAVSVSQKLSRNHKNAPADRLKDDCEFLAVEKKLSCELDIPDAASPMVVTADLTRRTISCLMHLQAPKDKQRASAKLNWLLRQLKDVTNTEEVFIRFITHGRSNNPQVSLQMAKDNPNAALTQNGEEIQPLAFDVVMIHDIAGKFSGRSTFIESLKEVAEKFYKGVGQNLKAWTADAPKAKKEDDVPEIGQEQVVTLVQVPAGEGTEIKKAEDVSEAETEKATVNK